MPVLCHGVQNANTLSLSLPGSVCLVQSGFLALCAQTLEKHSRCFIACLDAVLVVKNVCLKVELRGVAGPPCIVPLCKSLLQWYPPQPEYQFPICTHIIGARLCVLLSPCAASS